MMTRRLPLVVVFLLLSLSSASGQEGARGPEQLGTVVFPTSCRPEVQADFNRAVALLHSFWFEAAGKAFGEVAAADPGCGMAHWGTAMTVLGNPFTWPPAPKALAEGAAALGQARAAGV
jgi:hypothetical protein